MIWILIFSIVVAAILGIICGITWDVGNYWKDVYD